jgi:hypothetical protein
MEARDRQKVIQFTVLNVREKGWHFAPWWVLSSLACMSLSG